MEHILEVALTELVEQGYEKVTMLRIAKRAGASKETLYSWFGNKAGLFGTMIERNADASVEKIDKAMSKATLVVTSTDTSPTTPTDTSTTTSAGISTDKPPEQVLTSFCQGLLELLTSDASIALNRAAMTSPDLATVLLESGRYRIGPLVEDYLASLNKRGIINIDSPGQAFELLYGLTVRDTQTRVLLGEQPPGKAQVRQRAQLAVAQFFQLTTN